MNIDDSYAPRSCTVKSKYFSAGSAMDESLSDFQEPKKSCAGPKKAVNNPKKTVNKPKKATKKPRGQKDIRTALKSTTKDLVTYSKDFDKVCKKAGIDIDSEELQLAIALSKSLQNTPSSSNDSGESSQTQLNSFTQGRIGKIRTTLQEYGFKVPEIKIAGNSRKAPRKHRTQYKLIQASDTEKKEIIAEKYSQILFQDISHCSLYGSEVDTSNLPIYHLASNVSYDIIKLADTFYINNNVIEKSASNGNLLRDWSTIPGRPESPKLFEPMSVNFSEIECSQDELDIVLSGTINRCRNLVGKKIENWLDCKECKTDNISSKLEINRQENIGNNSDKTLMETMKEANNQENMAVTQETKYRSCSPDMFDEDSSGLFDDSKPEIGSIHIKKSTETYKDKGTSIIVMDLTQSLPENSTLMKRKSNHMELTTCIPMSQKNSLIINETVSQQSQNSVGTKKKSNNFMENAAECVANSYHLLNNKDEIQSPQIMDETGNNIGKIEETQRYNTIDLKSNDIDLTACPEINQTEPANKNTCNEETNNYLQTMDLTQSSNSSDELPYVCLTGRSNKSMDDTILVDVNDYKNINKNKILQTDAEVHIDLTQFVQKENGTSVHSQSFFEEYDHDHSESTEDDKESFGIVVKEKTNDNNIPNTLQSPRKRMRKENYLGAGNNNEHSVLLTASTIEVVTVPVEKHPANNLRYPKPGKVDLTIDRFDKNGFIITRQERMIKDASDNDNFLQDYSDKIDLTQNLDTLNKSDHANNANTSNESKHEKSNSFNTLQDPIYDIDLTEHSDESGDLSQASTVSASDILKNDDFLSNQSRINSSNKTKQYNQETSTNHDNIGATDHNDLPSLRSSECCSSLGKKDDMSVDYDELINTGANSESKSMVDVNPNSKLEFSRNNSMVSNCSQNSELFDLTDKELDYSLQQSKLELPKDNFEFGGISVMDDLSNLGTSTDIHNSKTNLEEIKSFQNVPNINGKKIDRCKEISPIKHRRLTEIATPQKPSSSMITVTTPNNSELIIKTNNVTPMKDYASMATPDLHKELDKYGVKPFKRKRAIQLLTHIYIQTHPIFENADELESPPKRHKPNKYSQSSPNKILSPRKLITSPIKYTDINVDETSNKSKDRKRENEEKSDNLSQKNGKSKGKGKGKKSRSNQKENHENNDLGNSQKNIGSLSKGGAETLQRINRDEQAFVVKEIECNPKDWVFQKREKAKVHSCQVPLHIAFYNYVSSRRDLREAILCYEPVEIDVIHKDLVSYGHRYDPKDLLKFLDKKCITVKTTDNDARNQKR